MYRNIIIPVAFDIETDRSDVVDLARLLSSEGAHVTFLHVVERIPGYALSYIPDDLLKETRIAIQTALDELAAQLPNAQGIVIEGHAGRSILDWADEHAPDLIIVSSHQPGMQDLLLGSTASQVVRHAKCAVHVLR
ncbi:MAG: universal stress protein [Marinibacterium sp.]|nr:universal stress protein [Marinibacterium sp.]